MGGLRLGERGGGGRRRHYSVTDTARPTSYIFPPDPGFNQDAIEESDLTDVIDLTELSDLEENLLNTPPNVFLDNEAMEVPTRGPPPQKKFRYR